MNILLESHSLIPPRTGIGRSTETLLKRLQQHPAIDQLILFFSVFPLGSRWRLVEQMVSDLSLKVTFYRFPFPYGSLLSLWNRWDQPEMDRLIPNLHLIHGPAHVLPSCRHSATVFTVHDTSLLDHPEWYPPESRHFARQIQRGIQRANRIIVPSEWVRQCLCQRCSVPVERVRVIPHEVDSLVQILSNEEKAELVQQQNRFDFPYLFWNGEINPRKNLPLLFHTLRRLHETGFRDLRLVLAGTLGYLNRQILQQASDLGLQISSLQDSNYNRHADIILCGYVTDTTLTSLYTCAEVFIFPSWDEGFGFPVLEAMACSTPVVCSSLGSLPELCQQSAILLDPHEGHEPFAEAVRSLLTTPQLHQTYQKLGRMRLQEYRPMNHVDSVIQVYQEAIETRQSHPSQQA
ncbi:MAG: glycosyltransferase family 4 protein [bacterium]|jgi:alpha-1,3-rhamnosyl/mannosyltransferase